jgi:hypothetical protein
MDSYTRNIYCASKVAPLSRFLHLTICPTANIKQFPRLLPTTLITLSCDLEIFQLAVKGQKFQSFEFTKLIRAIYNIYKVSKGKGKS